MNNPFTTEQYLLSDFGHTLFPLNTTKLLVETAPQLLRDFVYDKVLSNSGGVPGFSVQQRCYAAKKGHHLRRTVKLDPVAEYFVYDLVFRNRKTFRRDHRPSRLTFGYRFEEGRPARITDSYKKFKSAVAWSRSHWTLTLKTDISTYVNSIYHHDIVKTAEAGVVPIVSITRPAGCAASGAAA